MLGKRFDANFLGLTHDNTLGGGLAPHEIKNETERQAAPRECARERRSPLAPMEKKGSARIIACASYESWVSAGGAGAGAVGERGTS
jgi:hypothetical protein